MRTRHLNPDTEQLLQRDGVLSVADFLALWPDMPAPSVYSRIRSLVKAGRLSQVGKGKYQATHKPQFSIEITDWMKEVSQYLIDTCEGINFCLIQKGENLYIEMSRHEIPIVLNQLQKRYPKVVLQKDAKRFPAVLEGYIIVGHIVSDAPVITTDHYSVPSLEKMLVDGICSKQEDPLAFQKAQEVYPVNYNRLRRYAARRGVAEELSARFSALKQDRIAMFEAVQKYLATVPVLRAWVFGSFARGEEKKDSDLDLIVDYDKSIKLSLLDVIRYKRELESIIGREVDWVENGYLRPFARPSAEKDKYLIYER